MKPDFTKEYSLSAVVDCLDGKWTADVYFEIHPGDSDEDPQTTHVCYLGQSHDSEAAAQAQCEQFCRQPVSDLQAEYWETA